MKLDDPRLLEASGERTRERSTLESGRGTVGGEGLPTLPPLLNDRERAFVRPSAEQFPGAS